MVTLMNLFCLISSSYSLFLWMVHSPKEYKIHFTHFLLLQGNRIVKYCETCINK